ncbi:MAG: RT0821/Lpp0805 family surface protein [Pseudomonadota bacterium]
MTISHSLSRAVGAPRAIARLAVAGALALSLAACAQDGTINKQTLGAGIGAASGVAIGSVIGSGGGRTAAMIIGGLAGGLIGSEIGRTMDENDRLRAQQATSNALEYSPTGQPVAWSNPDSGYSGSVTPGASFVEGGQNCRPYTQAITVDGRTELAEGVACRDPNSATWRVVNG